MRIEKIEGKQMIGFGTATRPLLLVKLFEFACKVQSTKPSQHDFHDIVHWFCMHGSWI